MELRDRCDVVLLMSEKRQRNERVLQDKLETFINQYSLINLGFGICEQLLSFASKSRNLARVVAPYV